MKSKRNRIAYVYKLVNPENKKPYYIGVTLNKNTRKSNHIGSPKTPTGLYLKEKGVLPEFVIIEECIASNAQERESFWMKEYSTTIENLTKASNYSINSGRKTVKDKKKALRIYVKDSEIKAMGGEKKAINKLYAFVEREVNKFTI